LPRLGAGRELQSNRAIRSVNIRFGTEHRLPGRNFQIMDEVRYKFKDGVKNELTLVKFIR